MKVRRYFNTTKKEVDSKKFNIFIGISLGNRWFDKENLREYLNWALEHTKGKVLFLITDKIQAINYNIRSHSSLESNLRRALRNGEKMKELVKSLISEFPKDEQNRIKILKWEEYEQYDKFYKKYKPLIYNEFEKNIKFKKEILRLVKDSIRDKEFSEEEYLGFSKYLLEEFIVLYSGISYNGENYELFIYPQELLLDSFIEELQQGKIFPKLNRKLAKEKVAWIISN